jgi:hypothetical protein
VVGNSGVLLDAVAGTAIDAHDTVIRFNAAPTKVYKLDWRVSSLWLELQLSSSLPWQKCD